MLHTYSPSHRAAVPAKEHLSAREAQEGQPVYEGLLWQVKLLHSHLCDLWKNGQININDYEGEEKWLQYLATRQIIDFIQTNSLQIQYKFIRN